MASPNIYPNGIGGTVGSDVVSLSPLYCSGSIYYVDSSSGSDTYTGLERNKPFATFSAAYTAAANNDLIVLFSGHSETYTAGVTISKTGLSIIGEGSGTSAPSFIRNFDGSMFTISGAGTQLRNILFSGGTYTSTSAKVTVSCASLYAESLYFQASSYDTGAQLELTTGANNAFMDTLTFISSATSVTAQPAIGLKITNAVSDLHIENIIFDGGSSGWSNPYAFLGSGAITRLCAKDISLLNDSDVSFVTGTTGVYWPLSKSGSNRIVWAA